VQHHRLQQQHQLVAATAREREREREREQRGIIVRSDSSSARFWKSYISATFCRSSARSQPPSSGVVLHPFCMKAARWPRRPATSTGARCTVSIDRVGRRRRGVSYDRHVEFHRNADREKVFRACLRISTRPRSDPSSARRALST
jgi:hypothetical protein